MSAIDLKIARIRQGWKQLEVAREAGIHQTRLSKIENGWEEPRPEEVAAIRAVLKLDEAQTESKQVASAA